MYALMMRDLREAQGMGSAMREQVDAVLMGQPVGDEQKVSSRNEGPTQAERDAWGTSAQALEGKKALDALIGSL